MRYRLDVYADRECERRGEVLSLSASSDAQALEQTERVRWRCECAGESRVLVLSRADGGNRVEVARMGSRRFSV